MRIPEIQRDFEQRRLILISNLLERVNNCTSSLKGNLGVFKALRRFYQFELLLKTNTLAKLHWLQDEREKINEFSKQLKIISTITENLIRRLELLSETGKRREDLVSWFHLFCCLLELLKAHSSIVAPNVACQERVTRERDGHSYGGRLGKDERICDGYILPSAHDSCLCKQ